MTSRVAFTLLLLCTGAATAAGQGKPPKGDVSVPAYVTFRCPAATSCSPTGAPLTDGQDYIAGDDQGDYSGGSLGASFSIRIDTAGRAVWLTLPQPRPDSRECAEPGVLAACNPYPTEEALIGNTTALSPVEIIVRPLDEATKEVSAGGLTGMACGAPGQMALVSFTTWISGSEGHWGLNFNPREMYHSTGAKVRRVNKTTWEAYATPEEWAELVSFNHSGIRRKAGPSHEGQFVAPFSFTISAPGVTTTGPGC